MERPNPKRTKRLQTFTRALLAICLLGGSYAVYVLALPVYWHVVGSSNRIAGPAVDSRKQLYEELQKTAVIDIKPVKASTDQPAKPKITEPLDPRKYALTGSRAAAVAVDGYIVVTWANHHYWDFARSWVNQMREHKITEFMVGAMDEDLLKNLVEDNINTWWMATEIHKGDLGWGSPNFHKMGRAKVKLIQDFVRFGLNVVVSDIDVMWVRDPLPFFKKYPEAGILVSSDYLRNTVPDEALETWDAIHSSLNIGMIVARPSSQEFIDKWVERIEQSGVWDQTAFNDVMKRNIKPIQGSDKHYNLGYDGNLTFGILPVSQFTSGHTYFVQRMYNTLKLKPYAMHATFQYSGSPGKRHRLRHEGVFVDAPEYYNYERGYVLFDMDIPPELLANAAPKGGLKEANLEGHFKLMNHQLLRLRNALAIAQLTGRALIMPELWCGVDKYWAPLDDGGRLPGTQFELPFKCPMDHVMDLEGGWARSWHEPEFGPAIHYREHSFLDNTRLPAWVPKHRIEVEICKVDSPHCQDGTKPLEPKDGRIALKAGRNSDQLLTALSMIQHMRVLNFNTMEGAFSNFTDPAAWAKFQRRLGHYTTTFCCLPQHPGWIWYDFFWDMPHKDRFGRSYDSWSIKYGDH